MKNNLIFYILNWTEFLNWTLNEVSQWTFKRWTKSWDFERELLNWIIFLNGNFWTELFSWTETSQSKVSMGRRPFLKSRPKIRVSTKSKFNMGIRPFHKFRPFRRRNSTNSKLNMRRTDSTKSKLTMGEQKSLSPNSTWEGETPPGPNWLMIIIIIWHQG